MAQKILSSSRLMAAIVAALITSGSCLAAEEWVTRGIGNTSCAEFAQMYALSPKDADKDFYNWATGFMSGWNFANAQAGRPMRILNALKYDTQQARLRQYCDQHPLQPYSQAVMALFLSFPETAH